MKKFTSEDLLNAMGLKVGQKVLIPVYDNTEFIITKDCLKNKFCTDLSVSVLVDEDFTIIQPKPTLTEDEKVILRNLPKEYKWVARNNTIDNEAKLFVFGSIPERTTNKGLEYECWYDFCSDSIALCLPYTNLFQFIKWEDEPYSIEELLKD